MRWFPLMLAALLPVSSVQAADGGASGDGPVPVVGRERTPREVATTRAMRSAGDGYRRNGTLHRKQRARSTGRHDWRRRAGCRS